MRHYQCYPVTVTKKRLLRADRAGSHYFSIFFKNNKKKLQMPDVFLNTKIFIYKAQAKPLYIPIRMGGMREARRQKQWPYMAIENTN